VLYGSALRTMSAARSQSGTGARCTIDTRLVKRQAARYARRTNYVERVHWRQTQNHDPLARSAYAWDGAGVLSYGLKTSMTQSTNTFRRALLYFDCGKTICIGWSGRFQCGRT
jgi:hypothetical protein